MVLSNILSILNDIFGIVKVQDNIELLINSFFCEGKTLQQNLNLSNFTYLHNDLLNSELIYNISTLLSRNILNI